MANDDWYTENFSALPDIVIESSGGYDVGAGIGSAMGGNLFGGSTGVSPVTAAPTPYKPSYLSAYIQVGKGIFGAVNSMQQGRQAKYNAQANIKAIEAQMQNDLQTFRSNQRSQFEVDRRRSAKLENSYARSGVEMGGSIANYISEVEAVQERNSMQRSQDMNYRLALMQNQINNMELESRMEQRGYKMEALGSLVSGGIGGIARGQEIKTYWDNFGYVSEGASKGGIGNLSGGTP